MHLGASTRTCSTARRFTVAVSSLPTADMLESREMLPARDDRDHGRGEGANASGGGPRYPSAAAGNADGAMAHRSCAASSDCAPKRLGAAMLRS